jgi:uncharacterized protein YjbI with pentapeptide repeats
MKPNRYLVDDILIKESIRPERGQLLITLCKSKLEPYFFVNETLQESNFTKSELINANLRVTTLRDINLNAVNLLKVDLRNVDARRASFRNVNLRNADLEDANFSFVDF